MEYPLVVGNWKMNLTLSEATVLAGQLSRNCEYIKHIDIVLCPPAVFIYPVWDALKAKPNNLYLGLQNNMWEKAGAYTGEISLDMTKNVCKYSIIGHSERRLFFGEDDEAVSKKVRFSLDSGVTPIVCIGETERFNLEDHFTTELKRMNSGGGILDQIDRVTDKIKKEEIGSIYFAYEPIIGTGNAATGVYASAISYIIRNHLKESKRIADEDIRILYGGSVDKDNVREFMMQPNLNGLLVGGASLKVRDFCRICQITSEVKSGR
jgi:triosephosphate isomerase